MAPRKRKRPTKTVKVDAIAHPYLAALKDGLAPLGLPAYVDDMEIMSALLMYTTPQQLTGMLMGYWQTTGRLLPDDPAAPMP